MKLLFLHSWNKDQKTSSFMNILATVICATPFCNQLWTKFELFQQLFCFSTEKLFIQHFLFLFQQFSHYSTLCKCIQQFDKTVRQSHHHSTLCNCIQQLKFLLKQLHIGFQQLAKPFNVFKTIQQFSKLFNNVFFLTLAMLQTFYNI